MKKRVTALFMIAVIIISIASVITIPASASTYSGGCGDNLTWRLDTSTGVFTISGTGAMTNYSYSSAPWNSNRSYIKTVNIENGVTSIGSYAFSSCTSLTSVSIPDSVTSIGSDAFLWCDSITSITVDSDNKNYASENGVLFNKNKTTLIQYPAGKTDTLYTIPDSVTSIGSYTFSSCDALTSITIGGSVTSIGYSAFYSCDSLTRITVDSDNKNYASENGVLFNKNKTTLIQYPEGKTDTSYTIPDSVTSIGSWAFCSCDSLTSITIPNSVTSIGSYAFYYFTSLTSITIPNSVTSIGSYAFSNCASLTSITIPDSVTSIGSHAFYWCNSLTSVTIPDSVRSIEYSAFRDCASLKTVYYTGTQEQWNKISIDSNNIPLTSATKVYNYVLPSYSGLCGDNITWKLDTEAGTLAISGTGAMKNYTYSSSAPWDSNRSYIKTVNIADGVTSIGNYAFENCDSLTSITIPDSVTSIGSEAFYSCDKLTSITIPESVTSIGSYAFENCASLTSITIPDSVTSIGSYTFSSCDALTSITIGGSVTSIGYSAFYSCDALTRITVDSDNKNYASENGVLFNKNKTTLIQYPEGKTDTSYTIPDSVTSIGSWAFCSCDSLTSITIPNSVTSIGSYAFYYCTSLTSITIPNSVTSIGSYAFSNCDSLTSITIPDSVTSIGKSAFSNCYSLTSITVDSDNKNYASENGVLFNKNKTTLIQYPAGKTDTSYTIPDSVTSIGSDAFSNCSSLTSVSIGDSVTSIGEAAFYSCDSLTSITIGGYVTSIGNWAFSSCDSLTSVSIPDSVTSIGDSAFRYCFSLSDVWYTGNKSDKSAIDIDSYNDDLTDATWHYNVFVEGEHVYDNINDMTCNICGETCHRITGSCGDNLTWILNKTFGMLTISGTGAMKNYTYSSSAPWYSHRSYIKTVNIADGVTSIGDRAFSDCDSLTSITNPDSVTSIGSSVFENCDSLTSIVIPDSVTSIGNSAFRYCFSLSDVWYTGNELDKLAIDIRLYNDDLTSATWHYNVIAEGEHIYDNACDKDCNICGHTRTVPAHVYDNNCDKDCNECGHTRTVPAHVYDNKCDKYCNECGYERSVGAHVYDNSCDTTCNECNAIRSITHTYSNNCDKDCNECGHTRTVPAHVYDNKCDKYCNECGYERSVGAHVYDNSCDTTCNECGVTRSITHTYSNKCDKDCNVCGHTRSVPAHVYDNDCDNDCSECGYKRGTEGHKYDNGCDSDCNVCKAKRSVAHSFSAYRENFDATTARDGTKTRTCTVCLKAETVTSPGSKLISSANKFKDIKGRDWFRDYTDFAVSYGIFGGKTADTFEPNANITRAEFVQVLANISKVNTSNKKVTTKFSDVKSGDWFAPAVKWASDNGIVAGKTATTFDPNAKITREEMCIMLVNYANYKGIKLLEKEKKTKFADDNKISTWAKERVYMCQMADLVNGKGANNFDPKGTAIRAEAATIFTLFYKEYMR